MPDESAPQWLREITWRVDQLVNRPTVRARFQDMVRTWKARLDEQHTARIAWNRRRNDYFARMADLPADHPLRTQPECPDAAPPEPGYRWDETFIVRDNPKPDARDESVAAWIPPDLQRDSGPKIDHLFPLTDRALDLAEKYSALAAVHDLVCKGVPKIVDWPLDYDGREFNMVDFVRGEASDFLFPCDLLEWTAGQEGAFSRFMADVEADLAAVGPGNPPAAGANVPQAPARKWDKERQKRDQAAANVRKERDRLRAEIEVLRNAKVPGGGTAPANNLIKPKVETPAQGFGSYRTGAGDAGQSKARIPCESAAEKVSSAGAQSDGLPLEIGPETPGKVRTCAPGRPVLAQIAEQIRAIPAMNLRSPIDAENATGRLLAEALKLGAFARVKHAVLRTWIDGRIEKGHYGAAFCSAANWFRQYEPHWPTVAAWQSDGKSVGFVKYGCPLVADAIDAEADVPDAERVLAPPIPGRLEAEALRKKHDDEIQHRKERHDRRHADAQAVAAGKWGYSEPGKPMLISLRSGAHVLPQRPDAAAGPEQLPASEGPVPSDGATMSDNGTTLSIADQIERLIADAEAWIEARGLPMISVVDMPPDPSAIQRCKAHEETREKAVNSGKSVAAELVRLGEDARPVLMLVNALEKKDYRQARNDWPTIKPAIQEAAIRARLREHAGQQGTAPDVPQAAGNTTPRKKPRHRPQAYDPVEDRKTVADWEASGLQRDDFERERDLPKGTIRKAQDRERKRKERSADAE